MPGRLAVDFGTSNSVIAVWDEARQEGVPLHLQDYGRFYQYGEEQISVVPSLVHYASDKRQWIGDQVIQHGLYASDRTFRWMKRYIADRNHRRIELGDRRVSAFDAGQDFLSTLLIFAADQLNLNDEEIALTMPVEAFEHYESWLYRVAEAAGLPRLRIIDEPSAAVLGYGGHIQPGNVYLVFDFGGGTLDIAVVLIEEQEQTLNGRRCRVLGKAGKDIGGARIDQWLYEDVLARCDRHESEDDVRQMSRQLLSECERAKERLSEYERADISIMNPRTGSILACEFTRNDFENLLDRHDMFTDMDRTIRRALNAATERGYTEENIHSVLMVGGSSLIPSVQKAVQRIFGRDRVFLNRPLDAVARGAAAFVAGVDFYDHIQHDYAIRWLNRKKERYDYHVVVKHGTPYPTPEPVTKIEIKAAYDNQIQLGLAIFEMGTRSGSRNIQIQELVFDSSGAARLMSVTAEEEENRSYFWINEQTPTFLTADPPAKQGEARFTVEFNINANKQLTITARDTRAGRTLFRDYPVVRLS